MKKTFKALLILFTGIMFCCYTVKGQYKVKSAPQVEQELQAFIESYQWQLNGKERRPLLAAAFDEMARLKAAWASTGPEHEVLAKRFAQADEAISRGLVIPPEGGQHNQWYQCDACQRGLQTIDATHHKCPNCGKIYSGFPYDNVLYNRQHSRNINSAEDAAWAWAIKGEKKYADYAAAVLTGYAEKYLTYPMLHYSVNDKSIDVAAQKSGNGRYRHAGHLNAQTLDEANLMIPIVTAYDLIYTSNVLSNSQKKQVEDKLIRAMADNMVSYKAGKSNWQTWHNAAMMYAGTLLGDKQMAKDAILGDGNGFTAQMKISVLPEGMWYENSWGYHYYTLRGMTTIAEAGRRLGMDIYSHEMLQKMYLLAFDYRMGDGSLPRFGDATNSSPNNPEVNEKAYFIYRDPRLLSTLPTEPTWDMILIGRKPEKKTPEAKFESKLIPGAGHAILATDGPGKLTAAITFGPYGGAHGHFDKLAFALYGYEEELGIDPGRSASQAYRLPIHTQWYKATTSHNTILVDGKGQKEAEGKLLAYSASPSYAAVSADAGPAFESVTHRRFLLLASTYLLVVDELKANDNKEHTFDWLYHNKGRNILTSLPASEIRLQDTLPLGYSYLKDVKSYKLSGDQSIDLSFLDKNVKTQMNMIGQKGDEIFTATGPFSSVLDRASMVIVRRKGQTARFITVLEPVNDGKQPDVKRLQSANTLIVDINREAGGDQVSFGDEGLENFSVSKRSGSSNQTVVLKSH